MNKTIDAPDTHSDVQRHLLTPINHPEAQHILAHINEEHTEDLSDLIRVFHHLDPSQLQNAQIELVKIYQQGFDIQAQLTADTTTAPCYFIAFDAPIEHIDELPLQFVLLKQKSDKRIGKKTIKLTDKYFEVKDRYYVTKNMLRLVVSPLSQPFKDKQPNTQNNNPHPQPVDTVPSQEPGYAYLFDLATFDPVSFEPITNRAISVDTDTTDTEQSTATKDPATKKRKSRQHCYYTLRKAYQNEGDSGKPLAWIDIFIHGDTPGGNWAMGLQAGDIIKTKREIPEKLAHLDALDKGSNTLLTTDANISSDEGQTRCLLIADETSIPTVARLLELWTQPTPPLVICVTQDPADQDYLEQVDLSEALTDKPIILSVKTNEGEFETLAGRIDACLEGYLNENPIHINRVWGALEASTTKQLRRLLQSRLGLTRSEIVIKVYWRR